MSENRKLALNVSKFLSEAADTFGRISTERFSQDIFCQLIESEIKSPIEDLFYIACQMQCTSEFIEVNPGPCLGGNDQLEAGYGIFIYPQKNIGKYRVDFLIQQHGIGPDKILTPVIVELDGHDFHDKDKRQRAYEKSRDRFLVKSGYRVLHFTGSEVVADPYKVAFEALHLVGVFLGSGRDVYDPLNPLCIE